MEKVKELTAFEGFRSLETHHCITGSMRHMYVYHDHPLSEEMLLGIGGGVGFIYWYQKGSMPFIGGRSKGNSKQEFEVCVGERTGVRIGDFSTTSSRKASASLLEMLENQQPVMMYVDMGYLPYFDFGGHEYHFGGHMIVICGYDPDSQTVLAADRDAELHPLSLENLARARGSEYKPFPPKHRWFSFDFSQKRSPTPDELRAAIREQVMAAIHPPISNLGVKGIRKAAKMLPKWPETVSAELLPLAMFNTYIFIDAEGGTGGGIFRYMFGRFLQEAGQTLALPTLEDVAGEFETIGDHWQEVAALLKENWQAPNPGSALNQAGQKMLAIADMEQAAWQKLETMIG